jgi:4-amino-4-deoxy-L-arabinose transferase-like glycosyltransferase
LYDERNDLRTIIQAAKDNHYNNRILSMQNQKKKLLNSLPFIIAILIIGIYILLAIHYAHIIEPVMDEGTYLLKGKWYWDGTYQPFEVNGPITNKPPLAFYSLGISQVLFGTGLLSGRYFAIFLSVILLIGQWLTVKRLAGTWWATVSIGFYIIAPAWIIYFSRAMTQVVTSLLIVWSLYFMLGKDRTPSQLVLGGVLSAATVMVRQNMLPLFVLTLIYMVWENGFRKSLFPIIASLVAFIGLNLPYWPQIYPVIWQPFFPDFFNTSMSAIFHFDLPTGDLGSAFLARNYSLVYEIQVFFDGVRYFFIPFLAMLLSFIVLFPKALLSEKNHHKTAYLAVSFLILTVFHYAYALYENNVLYSFPAYFAFYLPIGITLIPLFFKDCLVLKNKVRQWILCITVVAISTGIGLSLYREIAPFFMNMNLPSISQRKLFGPYELWDVLLNQYHIPIKVQEFIIPTAVGFLAGILILWIAKITQSVIKHRVKLQPYGSLLILLLFSLGILLSPTFILAANSSIATYPNMDIPASYEETANQLQTIIPDESLVYWDGYTPILFLYLPDIKIFPAQLNMEFYYRDGGDTEYIEKRGFWNEELALRWINEADFLVFNEETYLKRFAGLDPAIQSNFARLPVDISLDPYNEQNKAIIFERISAE